MKQMLKAKTSIDFAMFTFAQSSGIDDTMARLVTLVPRIRGVLDRGHVPCHLSWTDLRVLTCADQLRWQPRIRLLCHFS